MNKMKIRTVGDLKAFLEGFDDKRLIQFGTDYLTFKFDSYIDDEYGLAMLSGDLQEYLAKNDMS